MRFRLQNISRRYLTARDQGMWTLDPIDGTKGFLRGGQYAVCLALVIDSQVELGVVGCPNLPLGSHDSAGPRGCILYAVRGHGTYQVPLSDPFGSEPLPLCIPPTDPNNLRIWQSIGHTRLDVNDNIAAALGAVLPSVSMDSQAKYCSLIREGGIYLRLSEDPGFKEKIWVGYQFSLAALVLMTASIAGPRSECNSNRRGRRDHNRCEWKATGLRAWDDSLRKLRYSGRREGFTPTCP